MQRSIQQRRTRATKRQMALGVVSVAAVMALLVGIVLSFSTPPKVSHVEGQEQNSPPSVEAQGDKISSSAELRWEDLANARSAAAPAETPSGVTAHEPSPQAIPSQARQPMNPPLQVAPQTRQPKVIALDPGHGGDEIGAAFTSAEGWSLAEKNVNLAISLSLREKLQAAGYRVVLTRDADRRANFPPVDRNGDGSISARDDLQARVDMANDAKASVFISIHNNGSALPTESGTEVWYCKDRPFGNKNYVLARELQSAILQSLLSIGYQSRDRGIKEDANFRIWRGQPYHIFVLGPSRPPMHSTATEMPGALVESLFVSNPTEAKLLLRKDVLDAIALGYLNGIERYFAATEGQ